MTDDVPLTPPAAPVAPEAVLSAGQPQPSLDPSLPTASERLEDIADIDEERLYAMLAYLAVLVLVPLITHRDNAFVNFHVKQGLVIFGGFIVAVIVATWFPTFGGLLFLLLLVAEVLGMLMSLQGRRWKIPGIGSVAEKFKI